MKDKTEDVVMPLYFHLSKDNLGTLYKEKVVNDDEKFISQDLFPGRRITPIRFYKRISTLQSITHESE